MRSFDYTYDVAFLNGLTEIQTCTYMTTMTLADNGLTLGGVGSVTFSAEAHRLRRLSGALAAGRGAFRPG